MVNNPMPATELGKFLAEMSPAEQTAFKEMQIAMQQPARDLDWYWRYGKAALLLCGQKAALLLCGQKAAAERHGWMSRLAWALGCSRGFQHKTRVFALNYSSAEVKKLKREGITWGLVYPTFALKGKNLQKEWMARGKKQGWSIHELEMNIQQSGYTGHRNTGGRPADIPQSYGPAVDLKDLLRVSADWLRRYRAVWGDADRGLGRGLAKLSSEKRPDFLLENIEIAKKSLKALARAAADLRRDLNQS
jgi:hypothetical protein